MQTAFTNIVGDENGNHNVRFADALKNYQIEELDQKLDADPLDVCREFRSIAGEYALHESQKGNVKTSKDWELEASYWNLFNLMTTFRSSTIEKRHQLNSYNSRAAYEKELLQNNKGLYELWITLVWLQDNLLPLERPNDLPTTKWTNTILNQGLKSQDVDYPLREKSVSIDPKDKEQDHVFFKYIFGLLLRGQLEEALKECSLSGNIALGMIICGLQEYVNPNIDVHLKNEFEKQQGIKKHSLWRRTVYTMSQNMSLDLYERAIYSFLSGTLPDDTLLRESQWEELLLIYINQKLQTEIENHMIKGGFVNADELEVFIPASVLSLQTILDLISEMRPTESANPLRSLIASIILGTTNSIIHSSVELLLDAIKGKTNEMVEEPFLLRVVTLTTILLQLTESGEVDEYDKSKLITSYVSVLKLHQLFDSIPVFMTFLSHEDMLEAYSFVLSTIDNSLQKRSQIEIMNLLQLPSSNIIKRLTQRVFDETEQEYKPSEYTAITFETNEIDLHLINSVEWLIEGKIYFDSMTSIVALSRRFLLNGRIKSLELFFNRNDLTGIINHFELVKVITDENDSQIKFLRKELSQYENLVQGFIEYENWQKSVNLLNSESNIPSLIEKFQSFSNDIDVLIRSFLVELGEDESFNERDLIYEIRVLYIPYLIMELHKKLVEASKLLKIPKFISQALEMTNFVANESGKIYHLFQEGGQLKDYLELVAQTAILLE
ncbi:Nucleoporin NUP84 [Nakaseomyces bracarensis]|uniref:Nuclear pore complex protein n=1 Tax=Nakaseomyces bracarensis TaxID=273131 RepID=A0ABR4NM93_9SACH